jgi:chemotaxis protein MotA
MGIIGILIVIGCVFGGFASENHWDVSRLWQPVELIIIGGAGMGSLVISCSVPQIKAIITAVLAVFKGKSVTKAEYVEVLMCLYEVCKTGKGNMLGLEAHVETPESSEIFKKYPHVLHNHHAIHFMCDTLKIQISSPMSPYDLDELMDQDMQATHHEELFAPTVVARTGDAMPGLGIVAAVLGVIITMGALKDGNEAIGEHVGAALVGTFLGVLLSYGFIQPIAAKMEANVNEHGKILEVIKACLLTFAKDASPKVCVEFARRTIPPEVRPSFKEIDDATQNVTIKKAA